MLSLFYNKEEPRHSKISYGKLEVTRLNINSALYVIKSYYSSSKGYVRRPNMLVSLLGSLEVDITVSPTEAYDSLTNDSIYTASTFNIIGGSRHTANFNNDTVIFGSNELFLYNDDSFDFLDSNYMNTPALTCISSNRNDIFLTHPTKFSDSVVDYDYYLYKLNVNMLGMQYYYWCKEQLSMELDIDPARFVYEVVLVNVIPSIFNTNMVNRVIDIANDVYVNEYSNYNPFYIKDYSKAIDDVYDFFLRKIHKHRSVYYKDVLTTLPLLTEGTLYDHLTITDLYLSKKDKWFYILGRLDIVNFLLSNFFSKKETAYHSDIMTDFSYMTRNKYLITDNKEVNSLLVKKEDELKHNLYFRS